MQSYHDYDSFCPAKHDVYSVFSTEGGLNVNIGHIVYIQHNIVTYSQCNLVCLCSHILLLLVCEGHLKQSLHIAINPCTCTGTCTCNDALALFGMNHHSATLILSACVIMKLKISLNLPSRLAKRICRVSLLKDLSSRRCKGIT